MKCPGEGFTFYKFIKIIILYSRFNISLGDEKIQAQFVRYQYYNLDV